MNTDTLFEAACIAENLSVVSKKQLLQEMAELAVRCGAVGDTNLQVRDVVAAVMERERLGSTGFGSGVAIPHARLDGLKEVKAVFARLETPLDYEAVDDRPVDLVVLLLAPKNASSDHLKALAQVSRLLRREDMRERLRAAPGDGAIHTLLTEGRTASAA
ncbi:MAG TPA: transcriptional regulator [Hellea balneolensis]|uniref:Transcriptional regulator n=1 Tax=Hellea balneolensis TaxID=287478 RepID=A0A7C5R1I9_9PROT|nr:transcriptional regulator [Hellea balneolensis]